MRYNKELFVNYVVNKMDRTINESHINSVITILFEEVMADFMQRKRFKIGNFGVFSLKKMRSRKYFDFRFQKVVECAGGKNVLKFLAIQKIRDLLCSLIDLDKTDPQ